MVGSEGACYFVDGFACLGTFSGGYVVVGAVFCCLLFSLLYEDGVSGCGEGLQVAFGSPGPEVGH